MSAFIAKMEPERKRACSPLFVLWRLRSANSFPPRNSISLFAPPPSAPALLPPSLAPLHQIRNISFSLQMIGSYVFVYWLGALFLFQMVTMPVVVDASTAKPHPKPTAKPHPKPTAKPVEKPTAKPAKVPTKAPAKGPTAKPVRHPSVKPSIRPRREPTHEPSRKPSERYVDAVHI